MKHKHQQLRYETLIIHMLCFVLCLLLFVAPLSGEPVFGGRFNSEYYSEGQGGAVSQEITALGNFLFAFYAETFTFNSDILIQEQALVNDDGLEHASLTFDHFVQAVSISSFLFDFYALDNLTISIGKFPHSYGQSEIINPLGVFSQTDYAQLLKGNLAFSQVYPFLLKASLFSDVGTVDMLISPFIPQYKAFLLDSSFFPKKDIPQHIDMGVAGLKRLDDIEYQDGEIDKKIAPFSILLGISKMVGTLDISLFGFYGWNADYPLFTTLSFDTETFSIFLKPTYQKVVSIGAALSTTYDRFRIFTDILYTPQKLYSSNWYTFNRPYVATTLQQVQVTAQTVAYSIGISVDLFEFDTFLQVEYYDQYIAQQDERNIPDQLISKLLSTILEVNLFGSVSTLKLIALYSFADSSSALFTALDFDFSEEFSILLKAPLFLGEPKSSFGQYKDIFAFAVSCQLLF